VNGYAIHGIAETLRVLFLMLALLNDSAIPWIASDNVRYRDEWRTR